MRHGPRTVGRFRLRYGRCYDSYLALEPGRECFWSAQRLGAISYVRAGRYLHASGGLLAADEHKESLLAQFVAFADAHDLHLTFYNLADDDLPLVRRHGFQATKWGEESLIDLAHCTWEGKAFEWVRRQSNYCRRQGLVFSEADRELLSPRRLGRNTAADQRSLAGPLGGQTAKPVRSNSSKVRSIPRELAANESSWPRPTKGRGRIEGILVANPAAGGTTWVFETYRHRPDAPRGCVSFLMHQALVALQAEGVPTVSLCLVPGLGCDRPMPGDSTLARWGLVIGSRYANFIFDSAGLYHFKTRFRPRFEARYLCARPRVTLGSFWSFIKVLGVLNLDIGKLAHVIGQQLQQGRQPSNAVESREVPRGIVSVPHVGRHCPQADMCLCGPRVHTPRLAVQVTSLPASALAPPVPSAWFRDRPRSR